MLNKLSDAKKRWDDELAAKYGGELEMDYLLSDDEDLHGFYLCAFHDEPKDDYDSWLEPIEEFKSLNSVFCVAKTHDVISACHKLKIPVCM